MQKTSSSFRIGYETRLRGEGRVPCLNMVIQGAVLHSGLAIRHLEVFTNKILRSSKDGLGCVKPRDVDEWSRLWRDDAGYKQWPTSGIHGSDVRLGVVQHCERINALVLELQRMCFATEAIGAGFLEEGPNGASR